MGVANANGGSLRLYPAFLNICKRRKTKTEQFWPFLGELESVGAVTARPTQVSAIIVRASH